MCHYHIEIWIQNSQTFGMPMSGRPNDIVTHFTFKISLIRINSQQSNIDYHNLQIGHSQNGLYWRFFQLCEPKYQWTIHPTYIKLYMHEFVSVIPFHLPVCCFKNDKENRIDMPSKIHFFMLLVPISWALAICIYSVRHDDAVHCVSPYLAWAARNATSELHQTT